MRWLKIGVVVFVAVTITALGIDAADTLTGKGGTMLGQLVATDNSVCPRGMVEVSAANSFTCIDKYEASPDEGCDYITPKNPLDTEANVKNSSCAAESKVEAIPWSFITREQAVVACSRAGKRLPKANEWYMAALGTVSSESNCNIKSGSITKTGEREACVSSPGAFDMVGNVWEWVADDVIDGKIGDRELPEEGYVGQVDGAGIATLTTNSPSDLFDKDYFWSSQKGAYGLLRGGFYNSEEDAGVYAVHAETLPTNAGVAIGFRCVL